MYTNADCLTNKKLDLQLYINNLNPTPDIIIITEVNPKVHCKGLQESEFNLPDYKMFACNIGKENCRGIILYVHKFLNGVCVDFQSTFSEFLLVHIKDNDKCLLTIAAVYRNLSSDKNNYTFLFNFINDLNNNTTNKLLIVGDFNFCNIDWVTWTCSNKHVSKFLDCLKDNYLLQHVSSPTRQRGLQMPHILDLIISNDDFIEDILYLSPLGKSDHSVLQFNVTINLNKADSIKFNYCKGNYEGLNNYLVGVFSHIDFDNIVNANEFWSLFLSCVNDSVKQFVPKISNDSWKKKSSWKFPISKECRELVKKKHQLWKKYQHCRDNNSLSEYKTIRNRVRKETRKILQKTQTDIAKSSKENPKKFWAYVNSKKKSNSFVSNLKIKQTDGSFKTIDADIDKANAFADFFETIYSKSSDSSKNFTISIPADIGSMDDCLITASAVLNKLSEIKINKSVGPDLCTQEFYLSLAI